MNDALLIRERILKSFERAERCDRISEAEKHLRFVIVGGGPTGVELAGSLAEVAHQTMLKNFRRINPDKSRIYLIEAGPRLLPEFARELSERAQKDLRELGVIVLTDTKVSRTRFFSLFSWIWWSALSFSSFPHCQKPSILRPVLSIFHPQGH